MRELTAFLLWLLVPASLAADQAARADSVVERGRYLAAAGNCHSCHTRDGGAPFAGGVAFETPFGIVYSTNITPDASTGIGRWRVEDLRRAMHEGMGPDGKRYFPAFPYPSFTKVTDDDVAAIYAYLRTLRPQRYTAPENTGMLDMRWPLAAWNALFFEPGRFQPDPRRTATWNRGAYLVEGLGHCGACHTPRNRFMAEIADRAFQGGSVLEEVAPGKARLWWAVDLTPSTDGLKAWSPAQLTQYLHKGFSPRAGTFGPMNKIIVGSLSELTRDDVAAMAEYLTSLPPSEPTHAAPGEELVRAGAAIYEERCAECHGDSGRGSMFGGPPLAGSAIVQAENPSSLINVILYGPRLPKGVSFGAWETMSDYGDVLSDEEIAAVSNFMRGTWGNRAPPVTAKAVAAQR
jgi:alcohol dehydrogenase (quinone), cytochrome c subunit